MKRKRDDGQHSVDDAKQIFEAEKIGSHQRVKKAMLPECVGVVDEHVMGDEDCQSTELSNNKKYKCTKAWNRRVEELKEFKRANGHFHVPSTGEYKSLYHWIRVTRQDYKKFLNGEKSGRITHDRLEQLKAIEFDLAPLDDDGGIREDSWNRRVEEMKEFKRVHGHFQVPSRGEYHSLYCWIQQTRIEYKKFLKGEKTTRVTDDRANRLKAIGFDLAQLAGSREDSWNCRVEELKEFKRIHGHFHIPTKGEYDSLYSWKRDFKHQYKKFLKGEKTSRVTDARLNQLKAIGFDLGAAQWNDHPVAKRGTLEDHWNSKVEELKEFKRVHGHFRVPRKGEYESLYGWIRDTKSDYKKFLKYESLYGWIRDTKSDYKKFLKGEKTKRVNKARLNQLKAIGFDLAQLTDGNTARGESHEDRWNRRVEELKEFKRTNGNFQVPCKGDYELLYLWIQYTKSEYQRFLKGEKTVRVTDDRLEQLKAIGFDLDSTCANRESNPPMEQHESTKTTNSDGRPTRPLGNALDLSCTESESDESSNAQKKARLISAQQNIGTPERVRVLNPDGRQNKLELSFANDEIWNQGLQEMNEFVLEHGHFNVPADDVQCRALWQWLQDCRREYQKYKNGETSLLTRDRILQLIEEQLMLLF